MRAIEMARAETAAMYDVPTVEEIRAMLATIPGSLSDDVNTDRGEY
jgi:hypothetical protein